MSFEQAGGWWRGGLCPGRIRSGHWHAVLVTAVSLIILSGCAGKSVTHFVREGADLSFIQKVAVMPFENNTKETFAPGRVRNIVITQILVEELFDVTETGQLEKILDEEAAKAGAPLDEATARRIGKRLSAQAFLLGSVDEYTLERSSNYSYPKVALTLRLVDAETGIILWQASGARDGYSSMGRLMGYKSRDETGVTFALVRALLASLK